MIGSLLRQIVLGAVGIPGEIQNAFDKSGQGGGKGLRLLEMRELLAPTSEYTSVWTQWTSCCPSIGQNSSARYNRLFKKCQIHGYF